MMRGPPIAPPLPRPPPPPPMMLPPSLQGPTPQGAPQPMQHMAAAPQVRVQRSKAVFASSELLLTLSHMFVSVSDAVSPLGS